MKTYIGTYISMSIANNIIYSIAEHEHNFATDLHVVYVPQGKEDLGLLFVYVCAFYIQATDSEQAPKKQQITDKQQINSR